MRQSEITVDLPVTLAVLFQRTMEEFQFSWEAVLVAHGSSSLYHRVLIGRVVEEVSNQIQVVCVT
jgi:hypothetical protein